MHQITLSYNPYLQAASISLDGKMLGAKDSRFGTFIVGHPMEEWICQFSRGYQLWKGFLLEAIEHTNDDALHIHFKGLPEDYKRFTDALQLQNETIAGFGYEPGLWQIDFQERFEPIRFSKRLTALVTDLIRYISSQMELLDAQECLHQLEMANEVSPSMEQIRIVCLHLQKLMERLEGSDISETTWAYFSNQLNTIFLQGD